jgi:rhodanese-related sulfurtransferase
MKNYFRLMMGMLMISMFVFTACSKDDDDDNTNPPEENKNFETLKTYLIANDMDLPKILDSWITTAENVYTVMTDNDPANDYYIIDIRSASDFGAGHIDKSHNAALKDVLDTAAKSNNMPIIVVCYTGQAASHAVVALRLSGYKNAKVMKWGMSGWNSNNDSWTANVSSIGVGNANWQAAPGDIAVNTNYGDPVLNTTATDGAGILKEQVKKMLDAGFQGIAATSVLDNPKEYFINNFWAESDVQHYGHIKTAHRILPLSLKNGEYKFYDPSRTAVTYCWTGQTSSMVTAYMNVLGYKAKSLKFGTNGMIHSKLQSHKWDASLAKNYPLVQ